MASALGGIRALLAALLILACRAASGAAAPPDAVAPYRAGADRLLGAALGSERAEMPEPLATPAETVAR